MVGRRSRLLAGGAAVVVIAAAGVYAVASAEGPAGSGAQRSISVQGTATVPVGARDSAASATAVYREAMAKALADGQAKAAYLAEKAGASVGVATTIVEASGYIECSGTLSEYAEYEGEQPDFGYGVQPSTGPATGAPTLAVSPSLEEAGSSHGRVKHRPKRKTQHTAKAAAKNAAQSCNLTAVVDEVFAAA